MSIIRTFEFPFSFIVRLNGMESSGVKIRIENLSLSFGGVRSLVDINVDIRDKEILAIIGPNGAGKTCLLNCINGFYKPQQGEIYFEDKRITRIRPDKAARLGLARTFQNIELYTGLSTPRQHHGGAARGHEAERPRQRPLLRLGAQRGSQAPQDRGRHHRFPGNRADPQEGGRHAPLRHAQAGRAGPGAGAGAEGLAARRADGGHEPGRERGHRPLHHRYLRGTGGHLPGYARCCGTA